MRGIYGYTRRYIQSLYAYRVCASENPAELGIGAKHSVAQNHSAWVSVTIGKVAL